MLRKQVLSEEKSLDQVNWKEKLIAAARDEKEKLFFEKFINRGLIKNYEKLYHSFLHLRLGQVKIEHDWELICLSGEKEAVETAYKNKEFSPESRTYVGFAPQQLIAVSGDIETWQYIRSLPNFDPLYKTPSGSTLLIAATHSGSLEVIKDILKIEGIDPLSTTTYGSNALLESPLGGNPKVLEFFLTDLRFKNLNPLAKTTRGTNLFHMAAWSGSPKMITFVADNIKGLDPLAVNNDGMNLLHFAAQTSSIESVKLILNRYKINPTVKDNKGHDAFFYAERSINATEIKNELSLYKENQLAISPIKFHERKQNISLLFSPKMQNKEKIDNLDKKINKPDAYGRTELHLAAFGMAPTAVTKVKELLEKGYDPNFKDNFGQTPFDMACYGFAKLELINQFLELSKINFDQKDLHDRTFLHYAANGAHLGDDKQLDIIPKLLTCYKEFIKEQLSKINSAEKSEFVNQAITSLVNHPDKEGLTPLHLACMTGCSKTALEGRVAVLKFLMEQGAIPQKDLQGRTPQDLAVYYNFPELSEVINENMPKSHNTVTFK